MKRITWALLSLFVFTPCLANIHIRSESVESVIKQKISDTDAQIAALVEYNAQIKNAGGKNAGVPASGIWQVCKAAGWDIKTSDGESKCRDFGNTLMKYATWNFRAVCDKDKFMVEHGTGRCIDNVFSNKVLGGIKVNKLIASGLAKEYARVKYNDNNLVCSKNVRKTTVPPDDYVQCISMDKNMAYEFRFDSVTATMDSEIDASTEAGVCKIFDLKYSPSGSQQASYLGNGQQVGQYQSWPAACETTDAKICGKINESMSRFGRSAKIGTTGSKANQRTACVIKTNAVTDASKLRTAFGIDNQVFKKGGIQLNATTTVKTQVCDYVRKTVKSPTITSCVCNDGFTKLYDFSFITETDDVLTCTINGKPVDFVFDDLSERNKRVADGGSQGMDCMIAGGTYAGEQCINLDERQCKLLASANIKNCPTCKRVKYQNGVCLLPSAADAENIQKNTTIALIVGGAVVGVGVTVMTGGAGAVVVLTGIETVGAAIELGAQLKIDAIADEFLVKSNQCKSASCAQSLIKNNFQYLADSQNDFSAPEISAIDSEMARLASLIPDNSDFWADMAKNSLNMADNQSGMFDFSHWTPEQWWRAVGITLQLASIITSVGKWVGTKTKTVVTKLSESTKVMRTKTENAVKAVVQIQDETHLSPKRAELKKKLAEGNKITLSDGEEIQIPKGRLSATVATIDGAETNITGKTRYAIINALDDWMGKNNATVMVQYDKNMKAIYTAGIQDEAMPVIEQWLRTNRVPYSKNGNYIKILETDLERTGAFARSADDPMITQLIKEFDDNAVMRALDNATSEDAMERAVNEIMENRATVNIIFKDAIDAKALETYASTARQRYLQIIVNDGDLARDALRFDELDTAQKEAFANKILRKYNSGVCDGGVCRVDPGLVELSGTQKNGIIQISEPHNSSLDDFMNTLAHENNHFHDESASGFLNYEQSRLGSAMAGDFTDDIDIYNTNLTEHASDVIGKTVGQGFTSELNKMIRTLR